MTHSDRMTQELLYQTRGSWTRKANNSTSCNSQLTTIVRSRALFTVFATRHPRFAMVTSLSISLLSQEIITMISLAFWGLAIFLRPSGRVFWTVILL